MWRGVDEMRLGIGLAFHGVYGGVAGVAGKFDIRTSNIVGIGI
jgi:hypothetical protein